VACATCSTASTADAAWTRAHPTPRNWLQRRQPHPDELVHRQRRRVHRPDPGHGQPRRSRRAPVGPPTIHVNGERALAELQLIIEWRIDVHGIEADLASAYRSQYRARRDVDGIWRIVAITSIYEKDTLTPVLPGPAPAQLAAYRPSYRFLSWFLTRQGYSVAHDELGDDEPERVAAQYRSEFAWLQHPNTPQP
jgi:hypothetical protein